MICVENISHHYKGYPCTLKDISFKLKEGEFLAILGNNGVGKSTLLKCLNHILRADSGRVMLNEKNLLAMPIREVSKHVAFVSQSVPNTHMTVHDVVMMGRRPYMKWGFNENDHKIVHKVMQRLNLVGDIQGRFLSQLSGGERQKVMLARALAQEPKVLLLDEPTSSLDIKNQHQVLNIVHSICREDKISAIIVIHDLNLALRYCDRFLLMSKGRVYRYGDHSVLDSQALETVYGIKGCVEEISGQHMVLVDGETGGI